ncbi:hypothetical protein AB0L30_09230 [Microbispora rosea]|uniref:SCO4402 family protein n=1 Tax=Microbispora rosea TaxID=58117 RepID=UPI003434C71E
MNEHASASRRVQRPEQREDVLNALQALGDRDYQERHWRSGHEWPNLTAAVHWLIDDTFIDQAGARALIPQLFRDEQEADRVQLVVDALLRVLNDLGPTSPRTEPCARVRFARSGGQHGNIRTGQAVGSAAGLAALMGLAP